MPLIHLQTLIKAEPSICFDVSRSIDVHAQSMQHSSEQAIAGRTEGLIALHETVTWRAKHFGIWLKMTVQITQMDAPDSFTDEMIRGPFRRMWHKHSFHAEGKMTRMIDEFSYASPLGILGKLIDALILKNYMQRLLMKRNEWIKVHAEMQAGTHFPGTSIGGFIGSLSP